MSISQRSGRGGSISATVPLPFCSSRRPGLLLALIIVYPVCRLIYTSFLNLSLTSGLPAEFAGLENYRLMIDDPVFWETT